MMSAENRIVFFGKPACVNNRKQRKILKEAGADLIERDLLSYPWSESLLRQFFLDIPKDQWVNRSAPEIKSGRLNVDALSEQQLLWTMVLNPGLIRRPLIAWQEQRWVGFDWSILQAELPINAPDNRQWLNDDLESCALVSKG